MKTRVILPVLLAAALTAAAKQPPSPTSRGGNELVDIKATVHLDKEEIKQLLGFEPSSDLIVVEMEMRPRGDQPYKIDRDDFTLVSHKDGQRAEPLSPEQIAGSAALVVRNAGRGGGIASGNPNGPVWGGIGGRPRQLPGTGTGVGNTGGETRIDSRVEAGQKPRENPALEALKEKVLPEKEITERTSGLLYFPIDGKQKLKDLELIYKTPLGRLNLEFR